MRKKLRSTSYRSIFESDESDGLGGTQANPGKISFGSPGIGTTPYVAGEHFEMMTGVDIIHIPYRGGAAPVLTDLIAGQVQVAIVTAAGSIELLRSGKLRPLAITSSTRLEILHRP